MMLPLLLLLGFSTDVFSIRLITEENFDANLQVRIKNGVIQGKRLETDNGIPYFAFQGIPYAKPPIKNLRFRGPKPAVNWNGILDATKEGANCVEASLSLKKSIFTVSGREDCLYVNVFLPKSPRLKENLPVLIFIYAGGFLEGSSTYDLYNPEYLLEQNIIVVTFNYRVGVFGFLSTGDLESPGNYGLKDQNLLLRWTKQNIKSFGGDPNKITLNGQSAGAASVVYHMISPKSKHLFDKALVQSGSALCFWSFQTNFRKIAFDVGANLGLTTNSTKELVGFLRSVDEDALKNGQLVPILLNSWMVLNYGLPFSPSLEPTHKDAFLTESSYSIFMKENYAKIPVMIGVTSQESNYFASLLNLVQILISTYDWSPGSLPRMNVFPSRRSTVGKKIMHHFFKYNSFTTATKEELAKYFSDEMVVRPTIKTIQFLAKYSSVYFYVFSYDGKLGRSKLLGYPVTRVQGPGHSEELLYIWKVAGANSDNEKDRLVSQRIVKLWTNFVKTGNPTPKKDCLLENVTWPAVSSPEFIEYLDIGNDLHIKTFNMDNFHFWQQLYDKYSFGPKDIF